MLLVLKSGQMIYIEYGFDLDNNRFGFGRSVEVERDDGSEYRTKEKVKLVTKSYYFRLWIGKYVLVISKAHGVELIHKNRYNFKAVFGIKGEQ
jgi:hypothetical protein